MWFDFVLIHPLQKTINYHAFAHKKASLHWQTSYPYDPFEP
ncbi:hypothetical protein BSBH6_01855 [Bacillus subtilis]|nr:hypothetical protein BSBH6_01855 [Bacillus subtilis]RPK25422.1 hypothetical protein BH5_02254 [Bacillus subtilis]